jgi:hypothetical protein
MIPAIEDVHPRKKQKMTTKDSSNPAGLQKMLLLR